MGLLLLWYFSTRTSAYPMEQVLLVGTSGSALLHRVPPINDPAVAAEQFRAICEARDSGSGDCV